MDHEFYILKDEQKIGSPGWYFVDDDEKLRSVFVNDEIIISNPYLVYYGQNPKPPYIAGFKTFLVSFENEGDGLDYHGVTIIPATSLPMFIENIREVKLKLRRKKYIEELDCLIDLCKYAFNNNKYVLHAGI